jgi:hypothetical protein
MKWPKAKLATAAVVVVVTISGINCCKQNTSLPAPSGKAVSDDTAASELVPLDIKIPKPGVEEFVHMRPVPNLQKNDGYGKPREAFLVPIGTKNVALGKPVSSTDDAPIIGNIEQVTDGKKDYFAELSSGLQSVTINLLDTYEIYAIVLWHNTRHAGPGPVYFDVIVQVSNDRNFIKGVKTLFNNDIDNSAGFGIGKDKHYREICYGKLIDANGIKARYVRLYSNGNNCDEFKLNHYVEVEVYGKAVK